MKKIISLLISILLVVTLLAACAAEETVVPEPEYETPVTLPAEIEPTPEPETHRLRVITTIFPQYDFVRQIAGDRVDLQMLISPGAEAHSFEPSPQDLIAMLEADLFVYNGGHKEAWIDSILDALDTEDLVIVPLLDMVGNLLTDTHDHDHGHHHDDCDDHGHSHDDCDDHGHSHDDCDDHGHSHDDCDVHGHSHDTCDDPAHSHHHDDDDCEDGTCEDDSHHDPHVWTAPQNVIAIVEHLTTILSDLDPDNASYFAANAQAYIQDLQELDDAFRQVVDEGARTTIVFGDRNPFRYFAHAYGLTYHAAFDGCSTETQANPQTIARLIETMEDQEIPVVFYIEFSNQRIADVLVEATGAQKLELHSVHNVSQGDFDAGVTYLELMWRNVEQLRVALR